jgi:sulfide:quinone oxidoreductase
MDIKALTPNLSISPQILISEMQAVAEAGFKAIICNRPDGEGPDQPSFQEIEAAARQHGLQAQYLPAETGKVRDEDGKVFGQLLLTLPGPVLAYCASGNRSSVVWALAHAGKRPTDELIAIPARFGYQLEGLRGQIEALARQG